MAWAKDNGVDLASVSVGPAGCMVTLARAVSKEPRDPATVDPRASMYRQFGGEVFKQAVSDGAVDENGLVPAMR